MIAIKKGASFEAPFLFGISLFKIHQIFF